MWRWNKRDFVCGVVVVYRLILLGKETSEDMTFLSHTHIVANSCWVGIGAATRATRKAASAGASACSRYVLPRGTKEEVLDRRTRFNNFLNHSTILFKKTHPHAHIFSSSSSSLVGERPSAAGHGGLRFHGPSLLRPASCRAALAEHAPATSCTCFIFVSPASDVSISQVFYADFPLPPSLPFLPSLRH